MSSKYPPIGGRRPSYILDLKLKFLSELPILRVWEHYNEGGYTIDISEGGNVPDGWNDIISSVEAVRGDWQLYEHDGFEGDSFTVKEGESRNVPDGWNDKISSSMPLLSGTEIWTNFDYI